MMKLLSFIFKLLLTLAQYKRFLCINVNSAPGIKLRTLVGREEHSTFPDHKAFSGGRAELPCNVTLQSADDAITLILWYRGDTSGVPIYSVDARHGSLDNAKHFPLHNIFGSNRASFDLSVRPALLRIDPVYDDDGMEYRCRVDFRWGRTMNTLVTLIVIVPPRKIVIKNEKNHPQNGLIGPYNEGSDVKLICESDGGKPPPILLWYSDNVMIDDSYIIGANNITVYNDLVIHKLSRNDLNSNLICRASNNVTKPLTVTISIDINLKPIDVEIVTARHTLSNGREVEILCESRGSRPPAQITWFKNNRELTHSRESISHDGNVTTSILKLIPSVDDHGAYLACRAENLRLANSSIEDGWKLNVLYTPNVTILHNRHRVDSVTVIEGDEIVMECSVNAYPLAKIVQFLHNGIQLVSDSQSGIIANNSSLVITNVRPIHEGSYQCLAINSQGKGISQEIKVDVQYAPVCNQPPILVRVISLNEDVKMMCTVNASPSNVTFYWAANQTKFDNTRQNVSSDGLSSTLSLEPNTMQHIDSIWCLANNSVGKMRDPCVFTLISASQPSRINDCAVINKTTSSLFIDCVAGYDGGLDQRFHLDLYDHNRRPIMNETNADRPVFVLQQLESGYSYIAVIYSSNPKGKSESFELRIQTLNTLLNKKFTSESAQQQDAYDVIIGMIVGLLLVFLLLSVIIAIICKIRSRDEEKEAISSHLNKDSLNPSVFLVPKTDSIVANYDSKRNPDLIPQIYGSLMHTQSNHSSGVQSNGDIPNNVNKFIASKTIFVANQSTGNTARTNLLCTTVQLHENDSYSIDPEFTRTHFDEDLSQTAITSTPMQRLQEFPLTTAV